jgi:hypothetical protein
MKTFDPAADSVKRCVGIGEGAGVAVGESDGAGVAGGAVWSATSITASNMRVIILD